MGHVATTGECVNVVDVSEELHYLPEKHDNFVSSGIKLRSVLCMPIFRKGKVAAMMMLANKDGNGLFTEKDEDMLSAICSHISTAMGDNTTTFEEILTDCEKNMERKGAPEWNFSAQQRKMSLYLPVLQGISQMVDAESTTLMLLDSSGTELYTEAIDGVLPKHSTKLGVGVAGQAAELGHIVAVDQSNTYWQDASRHKNYHGTGLEIHSELVVPLLNTSKKCLGVIKCINKRSGSAFTAEDIEYMTEVGQHISIMIEGPAAGLKRVLNLTRMRMQAKDDGQSPGIVCFLEAAQELLAEADSGSIPINPYVTVTIVKSDPSTWLEAGDFEGKAHQARQKDRQRPVRRFVKSDIKSQDADPQWNKTMHVAIPADLSNVPVEDLYVQVLIWDYSSIGRDNVVGQASFPLAKVRETGQGDGAAEAYPLLPIPGGRKQYRLDKAKIWLYLSRSTGEQAEEPELRKRLSAKVKRTITYRPEREHND